jgi:hypothetical protein
LILAIFWIGIYPKPFFSRMEPSVKSLIENANAKYERNQALQGELKIDNQQSDQAGADEPSVDNPTLNNESEDRSGEI